MTSSRLSDPLAPLLELPGVTDAVAAARDALVEVHNHPVNRRGWPASAAEASLRAARASAALDGARLAPRAPGAGGSAGGAGGSAAGSGGVDAGSGGAADPDSGTAGVSGSGPGGSDGRADPDSGSTDVASGPDGAGASEGAVDDPVLAGAVRVAQESGRLLGVWRTAPLQALARLHLLAGADLTADGELGRPSSSAQASARLSLLADLVTGGTSVPAPVLVAVVHGELLALAAFPSANGVVARAAARLAAVASGLDPKGLAVPEVGHLRAGAEYGRLAEGFAGGTPDGLAAWLRHCCAQWEAGAREGLSIANARS